MDTKLNSYEAPDVNIVEVRVEEGFAATGNENYGDNDW